MHLSLMYSNIKEKETMSLGVKTLEDVIAGEQELQLGLQSANTSLFLGLEKALAFLRSYKFFYFHWYRSCRKFQLIRSPIRKGAPVLKTIFCHSVNKCCPLTRSHYISNVL